MIAYTLVDLQFNSLSTGVIATPIWRPHQVHAVTMAHSRDYFSSNFDVSGGLRAESFRFDHGGHLRPYPTRNMGTEGTYEVV